MVNTIWFRFDLIRFGKDFSVCMCHACSYHDFPGCPSWNFYCKHHARPSKSFAPLGIRSLIWAHLFIGLREDHQLGSMWCWETTLLCCFSAYDKSSSASIASVTCYIKLDVHFSFIQDCVTAVNYSMVVGKLPPWKTPSLPRKIPPRVNFLPAENTPNGKIENYC